LDCDLRVGIDADDQYVAELTSTGEITDVADVQYVKAAVRENDSRAGFTGRGDSVC